MSDKLDGARLTWVMLNRAGHRGVHTSEIIASKIPGCTNPSQRLREVADHVPVFKRREHRGKKPGVRAWLGQYRPPGGLPVTPAHKPKEPSEKESPELGVIRKAVVLAWHRDYRDPADEWKQVPLEELGWAA